MGSFSVRLPVGTVPPEFFSDIPKSARNFLKKGFSVVARLYPKYAEVLPSIAVESVVSGAEPEPSDVGAKLGINLDDARALLGAISFLAVIASAGEKDAVPQTMDALVSAQMLEKDSQGPITSLLTVLQSERTRVSGAVRRSALSSRLLPSLTDLELMIDVRVEFEKDQVGLAVPVLLVHVDTDAAHEELWFQMNKRQVEKAVDDLKQALARLEQAEKWVQSK